MERATDHLVTQPPIDLTTETSPRVDPVDESVELPLHKRRFIEAARAVDPLSPLRRHPFVTVATAAAIGVVAASPAAARAVSMAGSGGLTSRLLKMAWNRYQIARARASDPRVPDTTTPAPT